MKAIMDEARRRGLGGTVRGGWFEVQAGGCKLGAVRRVGRQYDVSPLDGRSATCDSVAEAFNLLMGPQGQVIGFRLEG